ncbi:4'-phosphopantetheinyl transferase superfamily protein [bacterium AH-315-J04]|nr:4'-phosphopantetheinyl transferase superfamily protein [bacterium AH-315-J04]
MILFPVIMPVSQDAPVRTSARVKAQRLASRQALKICSEKCGAPTSGWEKNEREVPQPNEGFFWSVSHKRNWAAAVIADRAVGIDVEEILPRDNRAVFDELACENEWDIVGGKDWDHFFRIWTAKEATLKANGKGIGAFSSCVVSSMLDDKHLALRFDKADWLVEHFYHDNHIISVTVVGDDIHWLVDPKDVEPADRDML